MEDYRVGEMIRNILSTVVVCLVLAVATPVDTVEVVGQTEPIISLLGDDVILPCSLRSIVGSVSAVSAVSAVQETVDWQRPDLNLKDVHFYTDRRDSNLDQNPSYRGRTSLFKEELKNGNVSLKLINVKFSDAGNYSCYVPSLDRNQKVFVKLVVGAVSQPVISIVGSEDGGLVLKCDSGGWYPEPEMTWLDSDGTILPADGPTETETDSGGRYTVRGHVTIQKTDNNTITCRVLQQKINHKMETQIHVPDDSFHKSHGGLIAGVIIVILVGVAGGVGVFMWRKKNIHKTQLELKENIHKTQLELKEQLLEQEMEAQKKLKLQLEQEKKLKQQLEENEKQLKQKLEEKEKQQEEVKDAVQFLAKHKDQIIKKVNNDNVKVIATQLKNKGFISSEEYTRITDKKSMRMTALYKILDSGESKVKLGFYSILKEHYDGLLRELEREKH